ncbi:TPA: hypothetical protein ACKE7S_000714 [Acinetobacter baumannii]
MTLKKIQIQNIKGISNRTFELDILPNKPSLLVAPNGFGKSSFACAFLSLQTTKIVIHDNDLHQNNDEFPPKILIEYKDPEGVEHLLEADSTSNTISEHFSYFVINNQLRAKGMSRRFGGKSIVSADIVVQPVILIDTIPEREEFSYSYMNQKSSFGNNGKILPNITEYFTQLNFITTFSEYYSDLDRLLQTRPSRVISEIILEINTQSGTSKTIKDWIHQHKIQQLSEIEPLKKLIQNIMQSNLGVNSPTQAFLIAIQIFFEYKKDKIIFKKAIKYSKYKLEKSKYQELLSAFNTSWCNITPKEIRSKLIVEFPKAYQISNGQRDVITFISLLLKAQKKLKGPSAILIIDEVFDYLDDVNLIAVQYYITKLIQSFKDEGRKLYPLILTHLNPYYFKHYVFKDQKVYFLDIRNTQPSQSMVKLLRNRNNESIKNDVSKLMLHFHTDIINKRAEFRGLGLRERWGEGDNFYKFINEEALKYRTGTPDFDPLAVCCAVRVKIEKLAYQELQNPEHQNIFLNETKETLNKLEYAESKSIPIPEYFYLLSIIYNDGMHLENEKNTISRVSAALENQTIRYLIDKIMSLSNL